MYNNTNFICNLKFQINQRDNSYNYDRKNGLQASLSQDTDTIGYVLRSAVAGSQLVPFLAFDGILTFNS